MIILLVMIFVTVTIILIAGGIAFDRIDDRLAKLDIDYLTVLQEVKRGNLPSPNYRFNNPGPQVVDRQELLEKMSNDITERKSDV